MSTERERRRDGCHEESKRRWQRKQEKAVKQPCVLSLSPSILFFPTVDMDSSLLNSNLAYLQPSVFPALNYLDIFPPCHGFIAPFRPPNCVWMYKYYKDIDKLDTFQTFTLVTPFSFIQQQYHTLRI